MTDSWDSWDNAMKDVVTKWDKKPSTKEDKQTTRTTSTVSSLSTTETRNIYRQIRSQNVTSDDSQAVSCTEEDDKFQMVIDVKDFKPEHINVKVVDEKIVVERLIENKEGNSTSFQSFVRRCMLPSNVDFAKISSALSKDGVLKINAPKISNSRLSITSFTTSTQRLTSYPDPTPKNTREITAFTTTVPDRRPTGPQKDEWSSSFDEMVQKSQKEMQDMMEKHTIHTSVAPPSTPSSLNNSTTSMVISTPPRGVITNRDVIKKRDTVTEREEKKWEESPQPGVTRHHHAVTEVSKLKGHDGTVLGNQERKKHESKSAGEHEEILPDGTKRKTFTKSYETRQVFTSSGSHPKAL